MIVCCLGLLAVYINTSGSQQELIHLCRRSVRVRVRLGSTVIRVQVAPLPLPLRVALRRVVHLRVVKLGVQHTAGEVEVRACAAQVGLADGY